MNEHSCFKIQFLSVHTFFFNVLIPNYKNLHVAPAGSLCVLWLSLTVQRQSTQREPTLS